MKLGELFLGKPLHWLLWVVVIVVLYLLGAASLHVKQFIPFLLIMLVLAAGCIGVIFASYRPGERITREPFEQD